MNTFLLCVCLAAGPGGCVGECSLPNAPTVTLPSEQATVVASSPTSESRTSVLRRLGGRRSGRVVARLERRIARHKRS